MGIEKKITTLKGERICTMQVNKRGEQFCRYPENRCPYEDFNLRVINGLELYQKCNYIWRRKDD